MPDSAEEHVSCRICMDPKDSYVSLFSHNLSMKVMEVADVQVEKDDGLPSSICTECEQDLEKCYEFRLKVQVSDKKLRENIKLTQVDIVECNIKEERYMDDGDSDNLEDKDSGSMDDEHYDDEPDVAPRISEETEEAEPDPLNHVVVVEENERKMEMTEEPSTQDDMVEEPQVQKIEEVALDPLVCMKQEAETEIMDVDSNMPDPFGPSSSGNGFEHQLTTLPTDVNPEKEVLQPKQTFLVIKNFSSHGSFGISEGLSLIPCIASVSGPRTSQGATLNLPVSGQLPNITESTGGGTGTTPQDTLRLPNLTNKTLINTMTGAQMVPWSDINSTNSVSKIENNIVNNVGATWRGTMIQTPMDFDTENILAGEVGNVHQSSIDSPSFICQTGNNTIRRIENIHQNIPISQTGNNLTSRVESIAQNIPIYQTGNGPISKVETVTQNIPIPQSGNTLNAGATFQSSLNPPNFVQGEKEIPITEVKTIPQSMNLHNLKFKTASTVESGVRAISQFTIINPSMQVCSTVSEGGPIPESCGNASKTSNTVVSGAVAASEFSLDTSNHTCNMAADAANERRGSLKSVDNVACKASSTVVSGADSSLPQKAFPCSCSTPDVSEVGAVCQDLSNPPNVDCHTSFTKCRIAKTPSKKKHPSKSLFKLAQKTDNKHSRQLINNCLKTVAPDKPLPCKKRMAKLVKSLATLVDSENESICLVCDINCETSQGLLDHKNGDRFLCRVCASRFDDHSSLETHFICHRKFKCKLCDEIFLTYVDYNKHKNSNESCLKKNKKKCDRCGKVYLKLKHLQYHLKHFHTDVTYSCVVCGRSFDKLYRLTDHEKSVHLAYEYMECEFCHKLLEGPKKYRIHVEKEKKSSSKPEEQAFCTICGKFFDSLYLKTHMRFHDRTEYTCDVCGKTFTGNEKFKRHMNHVHKQGPFVCNVCQQVFSTQGELVIHKRSHRKKKEEEEIRLVCEICGNTFKNKQSLKHHRDVHNKERPYKCDICGATFKQHVALWTHSRIHKDVKKYHCEKCGLGFNWKQTLEKHVAKCRNTN